MARAMFAIKQVKYLLPYNTLKNLYYALVHSHLSYAIIAWENADRTITLKTMTLQKRAIRTINKSSYNSHTEPLFSQSQILKLEDLYQHQLNLIQCFHITEISKQPTSLVNLIC